MHTVEPESPLVVCSVLPADAVEAPGLLSRAPRGCGLVELRADHLRADEIASLVRGSVLWLISFFNCLSDYF